MNTLWHYMPRQIEETSHRRLRVLNLVAGKNPAAVLLNIWNINEAERNRI